MTHPADPNQKGETEMSEVSGLPEMHGADEGPRSPSLASTPAGQPVKWLREGALVYQLTSRITYGKPRPTNLWSAHVQQGHGCTQEEAEQVARLIAKAPEMVEALSKIAAGVFNCAPHQRFMAAQGLAEQVLESLKANTNA